MRIIGFFIGLAILSISCKKKIDDRQVVCLDSCTTVNGRFLTGNNEPIPNIAVEIKSVRRQPSGFGQTTTRLIAGGTTDNNGFYSLTFGLKKNEFGTFADVDVSLYFHYPKSDFLSIASYDYFGPKEYLGYISRKDTTFAANIYLPRKGRIKIKLENFAPVIPGDSFSVITSCGAGLNRHYTAGDVIESVGLITEKEIEACGNEQTALIVRKKKNGIYTTSTINVNTPVGQIPSVSFAY